MLGTLGLLLFLYCVGIQYGSESYRGLTSPSGLRANAAALCGLIASAAVTLAMHRMGVSDLPESLGMYSRRHDKYPALQAVLDALGNQEAAVGYSLSYPLRRGRADPLDVHLSRDLQTRDCACGGPADEAGRSAGEQSDTRRTAIRGSSANPAERHPGGGGSQRRSEPRPGSGGRSPGGRCAPARRDRSCGNCRGARVNGQRGLSIATDRTALDYIRVFASKTSIVGMPLGSLKLPGGFAYSYIHVRRGDVDLLPDDGLVLEFGDRVGVLCHRADFDAVRRFFGDSIKGVADFSYISLGVGAAMGLLLGLLPIPIPGVGRITLGLAGVLLVALVLGHVRRTGIVWTLPLSANMVLRNFGLTVFLAQVGIASGPQFVATVAESGFSLLLLGAVIMVALILATMIAGRLFGIPADDLFGIVSGVTGNPAILVYANRAIPTERPDLGYAMVFPTVTVAKILFVQIAAVVLGG